MALLEPTNLLLLACALIYAAIGELGEALVLLAFVVGITLLDAIQQGRSSRALQELARLSAPRVRLRREGKDFELPPEQVREGDTLLLEEGDRVAADARVREAVGLSLDESLLTGESMPVEKAKDASILAGSLVAAGRGLAEVVAVGEATELGRLGRSLATVKAPPTRLQSRTRRMTRRVTVMALGLCLVLALLLGVRSGDWPEALLAALALALAVLPNEIPVVVALFLALGALRLARMGVLARWPAAVESLGSATVLAVDKTGTLTVNRMAVERLLTWPDRRLWTADDALEEPFHSLVELAVLACREDPVDAMERAIVQLAAERLVGSEHLHPDWPLRREYPLQPDLLVFSQLWQDLQGGWRLAAKGAPEAIADLCHLDAGAREALEVAAAGLAREGLRVLAVARGVEGAALHGRPGGPEEGGPPAIVHDFLFDPVGLIGLADPLRPEVPEAIATARGAGVRVVMITGDGPVTARSIADQAGLPAGAVLTGQQLEALPPPELARAVREVHVFARVLPQQKLQLVQALQAGGEVVAMTGDGVNDAPALRAADIGVAMGRRGSAVAREAADLVLLDDTFASLVRALELGRRVDANLHRALGYTLAVHLPIAALGLLPLLLLGQGLILLPAHIALLHLVIDPACTVVFEALPGGPRLLRQPPRAPEAPLFGPETWHRSLLQGTVLAGAVLVLAFWPQAELETRRSLAFSFLLLSGGGLVWLEGGVGSRISAAGAAIGLGLWLLLMAVPSLRSALALAPLSTAETLRVLAITAGALALAQAAASASTRLSPTPRGAASRSRPRVARPTSSPDRR